MSALRTIALLVCSCLVAAAPAGAQNGGRQSPSAAPSEHAARGLALYGLGDMRGAAEALRAAVRERKDDADAWYHLGLALNNLQDVKEARKAFERAVKLRPDFARARVGLAYALLVGNKLGDAEREITRVLSGGPQSADALFIFGMVRLRRGKPADALKQAETAIKADSRYAPAHLLKSQALLADYISVGPDDDEYRTPAGQLKLKKAAESLENYIKLSPEAQTEPALREQLEALRFYAGAYAETPEAERTIFDAREVTTKPILTVKPEPSFTERARQNNTEGTVKLRMVLAADGTVRHILVVRALGDGLTEMAVRAARGIKFIPATKDGRPVSQAVVIEYNFNIY